MDSNKNWAALFFGLFHKRGNRNTYDKLLNEESLIEDFSEEQKTKIVEAAITTSSKVLISATVMTNSHNHITGDVVFPDGTKWRLTFEKVKD